MRLAGIALGCLISLFSTGCCMCAAPYDYCSPTYTGQCGEDCRPHARVNSAFSSGGPADCEPTMAGYEGAFETEDSGELPTATSPPSRPMHAPPAGTYSALRSREAR